MRALVAYAYAKRALMCTTRFGACNEGGFDVARSRSSILDLDHAPPQNGEITLETPRTPLFTHS